MDVSLAEQNIRNQVFENIHNILSNNVDNSEALEFLLLPPGLKRPLSREEVHQELKERFLTPGTSFPVSWLSKSWERDPDFASLASLEPSKSRVSIEILRERRDGTITGYKEAGYLSTVVVGESKLTPQNSTSFLREPGSRSDFVRGKSNHFPFAPGGLESEVLLDREDQTLKDIDEALNFDEDEILSIPPGFERGLIFEGIMEAHYHFFPFFFGKTSLSFIILDEEGQGKARQSKAMAELNITDMIVHDDSELTELLEIDNSNTKEQYSEHESVDEEVGENLENAQPSKDEMEEAVDNLLSIPLPSLESVNVTSKFTDDSQKRDWAHSIDIDADISDFRELVPVMAREYSFKLDPFQKHAIYHIEKGDSVFVAAHTSAGKTAVAEYAIALSVKHQTRAIYTSPIKALSNQKFKDFKEEFNDVGILTGDIQINPEASCLIMTTEILRSMLYRGADIIRDVEFVIFDEVHYVNNQERGVVWEEVIILLPENVKLILLSATVPNTKEFADWIGRTKKKDIYVVSTPKRPVPLEHYLYANKEIYRIVDERKNFLNTGWRQANDALKKTSSESKTRTRGRQPFQGISAQEITQLIGLLEKREYLPVICFTFSKRKCEEYARGIKDLSDKEEKKKIQGFIRGSLTRLQGIATDNKYLQFVDERGRRASWRIASDRERGEYTQMAGRAGRRNTDKTGIVIIACSGDKAPEATNLNNMILGKPEKLKSQFRLTYNMILNLIRAEALNVEEMIERSFFENKNQKMLPEHQKKYDEAEETLSKFQKLVCTTCEPDINDYYYTSAEIKQLNRELLERVVNFPRGRSLLNTGRIVIVNNRSYRGVAAVMLDSPTNKLFKVVMFVDTNASEKERGKSAFQFICSHQIILLNEYAVNYPQDFSEVEIPVSITKVSVPDPSVCVPRIVFLSHSDISLVTRSTVKLDVSKIERQDPLEISKLNQELLQYVSETQTEGINEVDWSKIKDLEFQLAWQTKDNLTRHLKDLKCTICPDFNEHYGIIHGEQHLKNKIEICRILSTKNLDLLPEYKKKVDVLKKLDYISEIHGINLKGRAACEMNSADELIVTELIFDNILNEYEAEEIVALLSCFVFQERKSSEKKEREITLTPNLEEGMRIIKKYVEKIVAVQRQCGIHINESEHYGKPEDDENDGGLNFGLVEVVYEWAKGMVNDSLISVFKIFDKSENHKHLYTALQGGGEQKYPTPQSGSIRIKLRISGVPSQSSIHQNFFNSPFVHAFLEVCDMFLSVQKIGGVVEREYGGTSLTISMQDGPEAGQTVTSQLMVDVPHCHVHIIPRKVGDYANNDDIYKDIDKSKKVDNEERPPRSLEEMAKEASFLRQFFEANHS
ncbi:2694_t:CDS:10 [Acaulospora colombiana]|uniref:2694_t:CDS:1 n=1 Tax=Acaulospora colombiana TaxID=27376 RepID=A0ACA9KU42_9GLOM|nr:2694_t:CDS:10 [Acaulospora colombiana]